MRKRVQSPYSPAQWAWVADRWREGYSIAQLASFLCVHPETVGRHLIRMGCKPEVRRELPPLDPKEFNALAKGGPT